MKEIFYEVINEAKIGKVIIDNVDWPISFNTIIYDNNKVKISLFNDANNATLVIHNEEEFLNYLSIYIEKELEINRKMPSLMNTAIRNKIKLLISYLFVNASIMDFENPIEYIKTRINFIKDNPLNNLNKKIKIDNLLSEENSFITIRNTKEDIRMETPNKIEISITDNNNTFNLPSIYYGISNGVCHIYSILNKPNNSSNPEEQKYQKRISRLLYKINDNVSDEEVKDISVSQVLSLAIFISILKKYNINKIKAYLYLPLRYLSREIMANSPINNNRKEELLERNNYIQTNITNKFLTIIRRVMYQLEGINISNDLLIDNGTLELILNTSNKSNNKLISQFINNIKR